MITFRENNFNLIRLFATTQVVLTHTYHRINISCEYIECLAVALKKYSLNSINKGQI